ncbi:MAG: DNA polymerase III subunit delta [Deltaproteobacteria bacterium]|nr:DNA polymerase III subunit delta [Deltaproteobacteria bacterium]
MTAQQVFRELESGKFRPFYLVVGEEPFQSGEIRERFIKYFAGDRAAAVFNTESFDGETLECPALLDALQTLPGLFDGDSPGRLVVCSQFEKVSASDQQRLQAYFDEPCLSTCFLIFARTVDKRKAWYKKVEETGAVIQVAEPYDREWPKWHSYFEKKSGKKIEPVAWDWIVLHANRTLSIAWSEVQKCATFVGNQDGIELRHIQEVVSGTLAADVFCFVDEVVNKKPRLAMRTFHRLVRDGESEIKLLSLIVRQFRLVERYLGLKKRGMSDPKVIAGELHIAPYFVGKIGAQASLYSLTSVRKIIQQLGEVDFRIKTGGGSLFDCFLVPYFSNRQSI